MIQRIEADRPDGYLFAVAARPASRRLAGLALRPRWNPPAAVMLMLGLVLSACGSDAAYPVKVHNGTDITVVLLQTGTVPGDPPPIPYRLQPDETRTDYWRRPFGDSELPATVRVEDQSGTLIFCRRYSYKEIHDASLRIEIVRGELRC